MDIFSHLKVVELASVLAGPAVGMFFAELGAQVIKVENKRTNGDVTRRWKLGSESRTAEVSAYYCCVNWNKEVLLLDLRLPADRAQVYGLVKTADIVVANFKTGDAQKLQMDYNYLKTLNQTLIYAEIIAFEPENPRTAFDAVLQAESGFMYMNGHMGGEVVKMPVALIDILTAHQLKEGILVALIKRLQTGKGSYVRASLMESAIASLANQASNWLMAGHIAQPMGTLHPNIAPYGETFTCADGKQLVLAVGNDKQFAQLCVLMQKPQLANDDKFATNGARLLHRKILQQYLAAFFITQSRAVVLEKCLVHGVPAGAIRNMAEVFELPIAQNMILTQTCSDGTQSKCVKSVVFKIE